MSRASSAWRSRPISTWPSVPGRQRRSTTRPGQQQFGSGTELTTSAVQFIGGKLEGRSICRPFTGNALRSGLAVSIGGIQFFDEYCKGKVGAGTLGDIEAAFVDALEDAASYALRGDELAITDVNGITRAVLEPQPPLTGTTWQCSGCGRARSWWRRPATCPSRPPSRRSTPRASASSRARRVSPTGSTRTSTSAPSRRRRPRSSTSSSSTLPARAAATRTVRRPAKSRRPSSSCSSQQTATWPRADDLKFYKGRQNILVFREERLDGAAE